MRSRGIRTTTLLLIAALAFSLGSVGTATAGGLTKSAVKKIATKAIAQQASTLKVASATSAGHATTADRATSADKAASADSAALAANSGSLGGVPATSYLKNVTTKSKSVTIEGVEADGVSAYAEVLVSCPDGPVLSGNLWQSDGYPSVVMYRSNIQNGGRTFRAQLFNQSEWPGRTATVWVVCAG